MTTKAFLLCPEHGETLFTLWSDGKGKKRFRCNACNVESVTKRRNELKEKAVAYKGGRCSKCGYDNSTKALQFHHRNPKEKSFEVNKTRTVSWKKMKKELDKCDILCANCHAELH